MADASVQLDPIDAALIASRFEGITREMGAILLRSARSPVFAENRDFVTAVFDAERRMVAQMAYIPVLLGSIPYAVDGVWEFAKADVRPGDVFLVNDPYHGNNHLPDMTIVQPVFVTDELRFWVATKGHHADIGGASVGGYNPSAKTIWEEGLRIPPVRVWRDGKKVESVWSMIASNVRLPELVVGDLDAQVGACAVGEQAIQAVVERFGVEAIRVAMDEQLARSERAMRSLIEGLPDGEYRSARLLDWPVLPDGEVPRIALRLVIEGDSITFDYSESSSQIAVYYNSTFANTAASSYIALLAVLDPDISVDAGALRPLEVVALEGTLANAALPAPTTMCTTVTCAVIVEAVWEALAEAVPELAPAAWARRGFAGVSTGFDVESQLPFAVIHHFGKGGAGASLGHDGWHHLGPVSSMGGSRSPDPELFEVRSPHRIVQYELIPDSGGAGEWRGGAGTRYAVMFTSDTAAVVLEPSGMSERTVPPGIRGGAPGSVARAWVETAEGEHIAIVEPVIHRARAGDVLVTESCGGGGYGEPRRRDPAKVIADVREGVVSPEAAVRTYGLDPEALAGR